MTKAEEMAMKTVHDLGVAGDYDTNEHGEVINVEVFTLFELTPEGKEAAQGIPDINEPMCIPITNIQLGEMEEEK